MDNSRYKFRAWNEITKTMIDLKKITPLALNMDTDGLFIPFSGMPIMQFTGLLDKNGKEIYESDLRGGMYYNHEQEEIRYLEVMKWYQPGACFQWESICGHKPSFLGTEIIGNVFESPELLKQ